VIQSKFGAQDGAILHEARDANQIATATLRAVQSGRAVAAKKKGGSKKSCPGFVHP